MTIEAKVILDSIAPNGARLTTFELTYPRFIHSELMTHRVFSRNAASSRAIPTPKKIERIRKDCAKPSEWGVNQKGMQASGPLNQVDAKLAKNVWLGACDSALLHAEVLCGIRCATCAKTFDDKLSPLCGKHADASHHRLDLHKQVANRILESFDHITTVVTTAKMVNHKKLRTEVGPDGRPFSDPTYFELATKWHAAYDASKPLLVDVGSWHLPYIYVDIDGVRTCPDEDATAIWAFAEKIGKITEPNIFEEIAKKVSVGRVARTSYMRQGQGDVASNIELHDRLASSGHWSPFEAVATPISGISFIRLGNPRPSTCSWCNEPTVEGQKVAVVHSMQVCQKCALGHVTSGNFVGWHQYRKDFSNEAGGD